MVGIQLRRYYFKVVVRHVMEGLREVGYETSLPQTHAYLKSEFLKGWTINEETWEYEEQDGTTRTLTNKEFIQYIERIQRWASIYLSIYIPDPNEFIEELNELN